MTDPSAFGVVPTDADGQVTAFVEKPPRDEAPTNEINAGTYVLEPSVLKRIPSNGRVSVDARTFPAMVREGVLFALSDGAYWLDTGTPSAYLDANFDYVNGRRGPEGRSGARGPRFRAARPGHERARRRDPRAQRRLRRIPSRGRRQGGAQRFSGRAPSSSPAPSSSTRC